MTQAPVLKPDTHIQQFIVSQQSVYSHMGAFAEMCNDSKQTGRVLTYPEIIEFKVKYNILMEEHCNAFIGLHLIGCKLERD